MRLIAIPIIRFRLLAARRVLFPLSCKICRFGVNLDAQAKRILAESEAFMEKHKCEHG